MQGVNASMYVYQEVLEGCNELVTADQYSSLGQVGMQTHLVEDATWAFEQVTVCTSFVSLFQKRCSGDPVRGDLGQISLVSHELSSLLRIKPLKRALSRR